MLATGEEGVTRNGSAGAKQYRIPNSGKSAEPGDDGRSERQNKQLSAARIANLNASLDPDRPFATMLWTISSRTLSMASLRIPASSVSFIATVQASGIARRYFQLLRARQGDAPRREAVAGHLVSARPVLAAKAGTVDVNRR